MCPPIKNEKDTEMNVALHVRSCPLVYSEKSVSLIISTSLVDHRKALTVSESFWKYSVYKRLSKELTINLDFF